jgi:hypothetical protein
VWPPGALINGCYRQAAPLPPHRRQCVDHRASLDGMLNVLHIGIASEGLPQKLGYLTGITCWPAAAELQTPLGLSTSSTACCWTGCAALTSL